jgi:hypothetical protein
MMRLLVRAAAPVSTAARAADRQGRFTAMGEERRAGQARRAASRRDFLKLAAAGAPAAAAAAIAAPAGAAEPEPEKGEGLRLTEHAKKYYDSARF